jgi:hypothetical protein
VIKARKRNRREHPRQGPADADPVRADGGRFVLVEGLYRREAAKALGEKTVLVFLPTHERLPLAIKESANQRVSWCAIHHNAMDRNPNMINLPKLEEKQVASRQIKKLVKYKSDNATDEIFPQLKQPESGRYLIQVDKQTKASYETAEAAQSAALEIKKEYPIVRATIFDSIENSSHLVELPS